MVPARIRRGFAGEKIFSNGRGVEERREDGRMTARIEGGKADWK